MNLLQGLFKYILSSIFILFLGCAHSEKAAELREPNQVLSEGVVDIHDAAIYTKVYVISDVHGMYDQVLTLLRAGQVINAQNLWSAGKSLLVITGDSIDKGAKSIEVINLWMSLQKQAALVGGRVVHTLGNHEAEFLANPDPSNKKAAELIAEMKALRIPLSDLTTATTPRGQFIHSEPVALRVGKWLFSHSGYYPEMSWSDFTAKAAKVLNDDAYADDFLIANDSILESKKWELDKNIVKSLLTRLDQAGIYGNVFGHQPGAFGILDRSAAKHKGRLIKIDNGMAPEAGANPGSLLVFTTPSQMNDLSYPTIKVIFPDGSQKPLLPE